MRPQCEVLLEALQKRAMTTHEIRTQLGIGMPATRIFELREAGHAIKTETVTVRNRHGQPCRVAKYSLERRETEQGRKVA